MLAVLFPSGADLKALVREASIAALKEYMNLESSHWVASNESGCGGSSSPGATDRGEVDVSGCSLAMHHFLSALSRVKPSVSEEVCPPISMCVDYTA